MAIEKWELMPAARLHATRANPNPTQMIPAAVQEIEVHPRMVTGAPLIITFENLFLRQPGPAEGDFIFDATELEKMRIVVFEG